MADYQHILVTSDLTDEAKAVADRAKKLCVAFGARLSVLHVIEPISFAYGGDIPMNLSDIQEEIHQQAVQSLAQFSAQYDIPTQQQHICIGRAASEIHRCAEKQQVDLIVVGSHGRHGLALLLGSTANGVLHGAYCDVLAVRVQ